MTDPRIVQVALPVPLPHLFDYQVPADVSVIEPGMRVLDLGCGNGTIFKRLMKDRKITGSAVEIDEEKVNLLEEAGVERLKIRSVLTCQATKRYFIRGCNHFLGADRSGAEIELGGGVRGLLRRHLARGGAGRRAVDGPQALSAHREHRAASGQG